jgi:hypothetical protein
MVAYFGLVPVSFAIASILLGSTSFAQQPPALTDSLVTVATGNKFQEVVPPDKSGAERRTLTVQNNNTNGDSCWVYVGSDKASKEGSNVLAPGKEYARYWPFASSDAVQATCASSSDTLQVEYQ